MLAETDVLKGKLSSLEEVNKINIKKTITGAIKGISYEDILNLQMTAQKVNTVNEKLNKSEERLKQAKQTEQRAKKILNEAKKMPMKQQMEHIQLIKENERLKLELQKINEIFKQFPELENKIQQLYQKDKKFNHDINR